MSIHIIPEKPISVTQAEHDKLVQEHKMTTWVKDNCGNKNSIEWWGSQEAAQKALDSLIDCDNCTDCSRCSGCSGCSRCSRCSGCSRCSRCSGCSGCSRCSRCSRCSDCSGCSGCSDCSGCSGCSGCSRCSDCSDCSRCSGCKNLSWVNDKKDVQAGEKKGPPSIPVIENIHQKVYQAVTVPPDALNMDTWHSCDTTHCRGGWVVTLAGEAGKALEAFYNTELAAILIYDASDPTYKINPCRFYDGNEAALEDMRKLMELEVAGTPRG